MADEGSQPVDFWSVLEEAEQTVETWPEWRQRYEANVHHTDDEPNVPPRAGAG